MSDEPIPLAPARIEPRGNFPHHDDHPRVGLPRSADDARTFARNRLENWLHDHG